MDIEQDATNGLGYLCVDEFGHNQNDTVDIEKHNNGWPNGTDKALAITPPIPFLHPL